MITKPNINELVTGLIRNVEQMAGKASTSDLTLLFTPVLTVLDRVGNEWASWPALLSADNDDIRATLSLLGVKLDAPEDTASSLASRDAARVVEQLERENRALKDALVEAIDTFDLPADERGTEKQKRADREILALLRRMLYREDQVDVSPARVGPTSGNPAGATMSRDLLSAVLTRFITEQLPGAEGVTLENLQPLAGGASREAWIFDVRWRQEGTAHFEECILMREPHSSVLVSDDSPTAINGTRRTVATEMAVIRAAAAAALPVPHVLWTDTEGVWLERPFSISRRLPGTADTAPLVGHRARRQGARAVHRDTEPHAQTRSAHWRLRHSRTTHRAVRGNRPGAPIRTQLPRATPRSVSCHVLHDSMAEEAPADCGTGQSGPRRLSTRQLPVRRPRHRRDPGLGAGAHRRPAGRNRIHVLERLGTHLYVPDRRVRQPVRGSDGLHGRSG